MAPPPDAPVPGTEAAKTLLVLIVDDNEKNRRLARDVLDAAGLRTLEAESGTAGISMAAEHLPDVILMDLRLRDMQGRDAARALASDARTASIPVVALTALRQQRDHDWFLAAGFAGFLEKPIDIREFPDQVRSYSAPPA